MNHQKLLSILRRVLSCPTAPFHEYHVRSGIERMLAACSGVTVQADAHGNLLARYRRGAAKSRWVFGAHMDHPAFVRHPETGDWHFLGGVPEDWLARQAPRRTFGEFAMWDLPAFELREGRVVSRACDDLVGCAVLVCLLLELERLEAETAVDVVFTRAEEVGFLGAIELGRAWPFEPDAVFVSIETSSPIPGVEMGRGPVIRAGDALSVFDDEATGLLVRVARTRGWPVQRALLDRGSCEATALQHYGIRSAGISVLLGNYHNCAPDFEIGPEFVQLEDVKGLVRLLVEVVRAGASLEEFRRERERKFEERRQRHVSFLDASRPHFA